MLTKLSIHTSIHPNLPLKTSRRFRAMNTKAYKIVTENNLFNMSILCFGIIKSQFAPCVNSVNIRIKNKPICQIPESIFIAICKLSVRLGAAFDQS